ncbi:MAG: CsbD family protein [Gammaproteobacteria bacterium]|nr:CsbD family protein [Gammaproteobacteria bacterium]
MNWERIEGDWMQFKGHVKKQWGKLTDDQVDVINGQREVLSGKLREAYGIGKDEAERQIDDWEKSLDRDPAYARPRDADVREPRR